MLNWRERILYKLFRPRQPRPAGKEASEAEIAAVIIEFIRLVDRANGTMGRDAVLRFIQHHPLGRAGISTEAANYEDISSLRSVRLLLTSSSTSLRTTKAQLNLLCWETTDTRGSFLAATLRPPQT